MGSQKKQPNLRNALFAVVEPSCTKAVWDVTEYTVSGVAALQKTSKIVRRLLKRGTGGLYDNRRMERNRKTLECVSDS